MKSSREINHEEMLQIIIEKINHCIQNIHVNFESETIIIV